jgi:3-deoxy-7-phosphoheptulonate synthase
LSVTTIKDAPVKAQVNDMVVVMQERATEAQIQTVIEQLVGMGFDVHRSTGASRTVIGAVGSGSGDPQLVSVQDGVHEVLRISEPYKLASRTFKSENTVVEVGDVRIGGDEVIVMAGPCSAETEAQVEATAAAVKRAGAKILRGGAFKPRSSPYSFQGLGEAGLKMLRSAADRHDLKLITEVMEIAQIELIEKYADILQVGARNMQNFSLLRELGKSRVPVLLKRGISATIEEWLLSAEYILAGGNMNVMLCERGIRTFESYTRNTLDISAIPVVQKLSHLPIIVDPSHGTGRRDKVAPMARAAVAAGADGLIIEVHCDPDHAQSDGAQSMFPAQFERLMAELRIIAPAIGRSICVETTARRGWGR